MRLAAISITLVLITLPGHALGARLSVERPSRRASTVIQSKSTAESPAKPTTVEARRAKRTASVSAGQPIQIEEAGGELTFALHVTVEDNATHKQWDFSTHSKDAPIVLNAGNYQVYTESSRRGFPQEAIYSVIDVATGQVKEVFERSHVPVNNIVLEKGEALRITVLPSTRPYNASFFTLGTENTPVALLFTRPYPNQDFLPGEFNGREQFSSAQIAIPFWGMRRTEVMPKEAQRIRDKGIVISRREKPIRDPEVVLGVRTVAENLAHTFVAKRSEGGEDFRGLFHTTLLIRRNADGSLPSALLGMSETDLTKALEQQLLWMMQHNVHRANEGGGYAGKTFLEDFAEGKKKAQQWPLVSFQATEEFQRQWELIEDEARGRGLDGKTLLFPTLSRDVRGSVKQALDDLTERLTSDPLRLHGLSPADTERIQRNMQETVDSWAKDVGLSDDADTASDPGSLFPAYNKTTREVLRSTLHRVIYASHRERLNYLAYAPEDLQEVLKELPTGIPGRLQELESVIKRAKDRLEQIAPGSSATYVQLQDDVEMVKALVKNSEQ